MELTIFEKLLEAAALRVKASEKAMPPANVPSNDWTLMAKPMPSKVCQEWIAAKQNYDELLKQLPDPNCFGCPEPRPELVITWCQVKRDLE